LAVLFTCSRSQFLDKPSGRADYFDKRSGMAERESCPRN